MKKNLWLSAAAVAMAMGITQVTFAPESSAETPAVSGQVSDASAIVGKDVHDMAGAVIGEVDAVLVDAEGVVKSVVLDVSGWLESEKLVDVKWPEIKEDADGRLMVTSLTKEQAQGMEGYTYREGQRSGQVLTESGGVYAPAIADNETADGTIPAAGQNEIRNLDGTVNTSNILGAVVEGGTGDNLGKIDEVLINADGKVQGVIVDVGGILGVGAHAVLLDWKDIEMMQRDGKEVLMINATEDTLKSMPEYKPAAAAN